jgi:hypothetical protein
MVPRRRAHRAPSESCCRPPSHRSSASLASRSHRDFHSNDMPTPEDEDRPRSGVEPEVAVGPRGGALCAGEHSHLRHGGSDSDPMRGMESSGIGHHPDLLPARPAPGEDRRELSACVRDPDERRSDRLGLNDGAAVLTQRRVDGGAPLTESHTSDRLVQDDHRRWRSVASFLRAMQPVPRPASTTATRLLPKSLARRDDERRHGIRGMERTGIEPVTPSLQS